MQRTLSVVAFFVVVVATASLTSCRPWLYYRIDNLTSGTVTIDSNAHSLMPKFALAPHESRRVKAATIVTAIDAAGHIIGVFDASTIPDTSDYYSAAEPYTFQLQVTRSGIKPV